MDRRNFVNSVLVTGVGTAAAAMASVIASIRPVRRAIGEEVIEAGDRLVFALGPSEGDLITRTTLNVGEGTLVYPEGKEDNHDNLIMLVRLEADAFETPTRVEWTADGFVAYSAICTHLACTVRFSGRSELVGEPHIHCPCHAALFDPTRGAEVTAGPAPRALPQLALTFNEAGELVAADAFRDPVGVVAA